MKIKFRKYNILDLYLFIFLFTMVNREFVFLGLDLRYVQIVMSMLLIVNRVKQTGKDNKRFLHLSRLEKNVVLFYLLIFVSNIFYMKEREFQLVPLELLNLNILHINNVLCFIVFFLYQKHIRVEKIIAYLRISIVMLFMSCCCVYFGYDIPSIFTTGARTGIVDTNLFGGNIRIAGFGEDANYTFLFFYTFLLITFYLEKRFMKYILAVVCLLGMAFSFSKTQIIMIIPSILVYILLVKFKFNSRQKKIVVYLLTILVPIIPVFISGTGIFSELNTMSTRYKLWTICFEMLRDNHFLPGGVGACRFYINRVYNYTWLVQSHSTYIAMLCELGVMGIVLWICIFEQLLCDTKNVVFIAILNYLFFSITCETVHLQYFVFITFLITKFNTYMVEENYG